MAKRKYGRDFAMTVLSNCRHITIPMKKEVKKMSRPYLEVKVVKVKKEEKEWTPDYCPCCGQRTTERKGNWVNGENLDKIKFPCFCSFDYEGGKYYGEINTHYNECKGRLEYILSDITYQVNGVEIGDRYSVRYKSFSLENIIIHHNIHILKGKIILFEEE